MIVDMRTMYLGRALGGYGNPWVGRLAVWGLIALLVVL